MILPIDIDIFPQKEGVFIVGGSIRDIICGRKPFDYDLAVQTDTAVFAASLAARISGRIVELGKNEQILRRVVTKDNFFDILPVNGDSIEEDLRQRDFTINAMAVEVSSGNLIDPLGGHRDIAAKKIRMVTGSVFRKDPVRLIRAYRMAAAFHFSMDAATQTAIARDANLIRNSAGERIREELFKILQSAGSHSYLSQMARSGLLFSIFPELINVKNHRLPADAPGSLFDQTLDSYEYLERLLDPEDQTMRRLRGRLFPDSDKSRSGLLKLALLFHDIGQPATQTTAPEERTHDLRRHASVSATMAGDISRRLRFSVYQTGTIDFILRNHYRPFLLFRAWQKNVAIQKMFVRFFMKCGDFTPHLLMHALAEFRGKKVSDDPVTQEFTEFILKLIGEYSSVLLPKASLPRPLNGHDLINEFGLKPSALFKRILKRVEAEHLLRPTFTREQAIKLVQKLL